MIKVILVETPDGTEVYPLAEKGEGDRFFANMLQYGFECVESFKLGELTQKQWRAAQKLGEQLS